MPVLTFRQNIPANTTAAVPLEFKLQSSARFIQDIIGPFSLNPFDNSRCGWRLYDRGKSRQFIPDTGSNDIATMLAAGESGWAPILPSAQKIPMFDQPISGPPYELNFQFWNATGSVVTVAGFVIVYDKFVKEDASMIYELVTSGNPPRTFMQPFRGGLPMEAAGARPDNSSG